MIPGLLMFGSAPVPKTVSWSAEEEQGYFLAECPYFGPSLKRPAVCQLEAPGQGIPRFGKAHLVRQRRAIALGLCDLCGRRIKTSSKVSLSYLEPQDYGAQGWMTLQVEPLMHAACAALCACFCPKLRLDIRSGVLPIRVVTRWRRVCRAEAPAFVETLVGKPVEALAQASVDVLQFHHRDFDWLAAQLPKGMERMLPPFGSVDTSDLHVA